MISYINRRTSQSPFCIIISISPRLVLSPSRWSSGRPWTTWVKSAFVPLGSPRISHVSFHFSHRHVGNAAASAASADPNYWQLKAYVVRCLSLSTASHLISSHHLFRSLRHHIAAPGPLIAYQPSQPARSLFVFDQGFSVWPQFHAAMLSPFHFF